MPMKVRVLKLNTIKALSQDRLFLIEMKILNIIKYMRLMSVKIFGLETNFQMEMLQ